MGLYKSSTTSNTESHPIMPSLEDAYSYPGSGTLADPYIVDWVPSDPDDPYNWSNTLKWTITAQLALCTWTVSFSSSAYAGGIDATISDLHISYNVAILGISLYVLGFALGSVGYHPRSLTLTILVVPSYLHPWARQVNHLIIPSYTH